MSDNKPTDPVETKTEKTVKVTEKVPDAAKKVKKSWSNPALKAMGIPRISLPSRNWMIFWSVLASIGGGIYYDKHQQTLIRDKYMAQVEQLSKEIYPTNRIPRRVSVFIAPPPNDFLEESMRHFRKYIKPILNAAAIDYEVYTENRQGDIRAQVAERIRDLRKKTAEEKLQREAEAEKEAYNQSWAKFFRSVPQYFKRGEKKDDAEVYASRHLLYAATDLLGLYRYTEAVTPVRDDEKDVAFAGGVICVGRGTYKEYMTGVQEGLLGPLVKPAEPVPELSEDGETKAANDDIDDFGLNEGEEKPKQEPVPKPYIQAADYAAAPLAPELDLTQVIRNDKNVPVLFEQPVYVFPVPKLSGFLNIPRKIYRYFNTHAVAEEVSAKTLPIVYGTTRQFEFKDRFLGKEEELDWPKQWVERGRSKNSEWVQELEVDERIAKRMRVYE